MPSMLKIGGASPPSSFQKETLRKNISFVPFFMSYGNLDRL